MSLTPRITVVVLVFAAAVAGQLQLMQHLAAVEEIPSAVPRQPLGELPDRLEHWVGADQPIGEELLFGDDHLKRTYRHVRRGQTLSLWVVYSKTGQDRQHHPEVCMAVAGQPEDPSVRQTLDVPGDPSPVQQFKFGRTGRTQWVFYWHYTLPSVAEETDRSLTPIQDLYRQLQRKTGSVTVEVFAPEQTSADAEGAQEFVRLVDAAVRDLLPAESVRGSQRLPVKIVETNAAPQ